MAVIDTNTVSFEFFLLRVYCAVVFSIYLSKKSRLRRRRCRDTTRAPNNVR